jgi:hypothetical protein
MPKRKRWLDTPQCPRPGCRGPGVTYCMHTGPIAAPGLRCAACGQQWDATPDERAQAERADAAWEAEQRRREGRT